MKIPTNQFKNTTDFKGRTGKATLNMDRMSLVVSNMISNYNFPELAVLREWVSNAHDAHVAAGLKRPVKVTLPSQLNPTLIVQDFGDGMSSEFVEKVYLDFGSSTKMNANDEIGGFGQGGKSALAIAAQYTMVTISQGLKSIYIFERSADGGVDFKNPIFEVPTDEPSGVTVQVSVDRVSEFNDTNINRVLAGWSNDAIELNTKKKFFSIPDNAIEVNYSLDLTDYTKQDEEGFEQDIRAEKGYVLDGAFDLTGNGKKLVKELSLDWSDHVVLVGPVAYIFKPELQSNRVLRDYMVASVGIGDVSFPSSREVIESSRTNRSLVGMCFEKIVDEADKILQEKADGISDYRSALALHGSPLLANRKDFKLTFKDQPIPTKFKPKPGSSIFEYHQIGNWRGVKNYKLVDTPFSDDSELQLNIETLVILDDESATQSIRNAVRIRHTADGTKPNDVGGFLVITKSPSGWLKAAARIVVKSSVLMAEARAFRKKQRDEAAAAKAAGTAPVPAVRRTRKDRIGEYSADWLDFSTDAEGALNVAVSSGGLMDFYTNHFDPTRTLVLSTNNSEYSPAGFSEYFQSFSINPSDVQFLRIHSGAKLETLRILLGSEDELKIVELEDWIKENFAKLAKFNGRSPKEIAAEIPFSVDRAVENLVAEIGLKHLHPKYAEILESSKELAKANAAIHGSNRYYSYNGVATLIRSVLNGYGDSQIDERSEFFFLSRLGYYSSSDLKRREKSAIRVAMNQMVENWLDNLALEEAEAEQAAEDAAKASAETASSKDLIGASVSS